MGRAMLVEGVRSVDTAERRVVGSKQVRAQRQSTPGPISNNPLERLATISRMPLLLGTTPETQSSTPTLG